ncbi:MAG: glycosyltransferase [Desulfovibrionaceae bacterium]
MKIVFCIDDNLRYLRLLQVAVRSLRAQHGADVPCLCVYAGEHPLVLETLARERIPLALYRPRLSPEHIPPEFHRCIGCFLKLELALVPALADDDLVLYCDVDVLFRQPITPLFDERPAYMAMARENTTPFFHVCEQMDYTWRGNRYVVPLPFPIWTYSSGVVVFNLQRLRKTQVIENFLAFCEQNIHRIGNLDQSLLNYYFGKRISKLDPCFNRPPYHEDAQSAGCIVHFHGPKPWEVNVAWWKDLRINCYEPLRHVWLNYLSPQERAEVESWM